MSVGRGKARRCGKILRRWLTAFLSPFHPPTDVTFSYVIPTSPRSALSESTPSLVVPALAVHLLPLSTSFRPFISPGVKPLTFHTHLFGIRSVTYRTCLADEFVL